eukprot:gene47573-1644_t
MAVPVSAAAAARRANVVLRAGFAVRCAVCWGVALWWLRWAADAPPTAAAAACDDQCATRLLRVKAAGRYSAPTAAGAGAVVGEGCGMEEAPPRPPTPTSPPVWPASPRGWPSGAVHEPAQAAPRVRMWWLMDALNQRTDRAGEGAEERERKRSAVRCALIAAFTPRASRVVSVVLCGEGGTPPKGCVCESAVDNDYLYPDAC